MESLIGWLLVLGVFLVGFTFGVLFRVRLDPPHKHDPSESVFRTALTLYSNTCDKQMKESAAVREFSREIVTELLGHNTRYANQVLTISDGALERIRIERPGPEPEPAPRVDEPGINTHERPDVNIGYPNMHTANDPNG